MQTRQGREGKDSGAHGELAEQTSGLGDGLVTTKQRRRSRAAGDGEDGVGGDAGRPAGHGLVERKRGSRRSLWAQRRGEAVAVATATLVGGGGSVRVSSGKRARGGEREERERKRSEGTRGVVVASLGRPGEAGGGRGIASARHRAASVRGEEDDRRRGARWARPRRWAAQCWAVGGLPGKLR